MLDFFEKVTSTLGRVTANAALNAAIRSAGFASTRGMCQPKEPKSLRQLARQRRETRKN